MTGRCLVTGGNGFLGRRVCAAFSSTHIVRVASRTAPDDGPWHEAVRVDIARDLPDSLMKGVVTVIHLAGTVHHHDAALDDDSEYAAVTVEGTRRLCDAARAAGVRRFVLASSVAVFPDHDDRVGEDEAPAPSSAYGRSKLAAEAIVREAMAEPVVIRFPLIYGTGMPGNLARMIEAMVDRHFPPLPRVANRRSMIHVDDAAAALVLAAESPRAPGRVYTATDGRAYSTYDVYAWALAALGRRPARVGVPRAAFRVLAGAGDVVGAFTRRRAPFDGAAFEKLFGSAEYASDAIRRELGFVPLRGLDATMPAIVAALRKGRDTA